MKKSMIFFLLMIPFLISCNYGTPKDLGNGYKLEYNDGQYYITNENYTILIDGNVIDYKLDSNFIIVKQKPTDYFLSLFENFDLTFREKVKIIQDSKMFQYWIIDVKKKSIYRPFEKEEFNEKKLILNIDKNLDFQINTYKYDISKYKNYDYRLCLDSKQLENIYKKMGAEKYQFMDLTSFHGKKFNEVYNYLNSKFILINYYSNYRMFRNLTYCKLNNMYFIYNLDSSYYYVLLVILGPRADREVNNEESVSLKDNNKLDNKSELNYILEQTDYSILQIRVDINKEKEALFKGDYNELYKSHQYMFIYSKIDSMTKAKNSYEFNRISK